MGQVRELQVVEDRSGPALDRAAEVWARAVTRRDGLAEPADPVEKIDGIRAAVAEPGAGMLVASDGEHAVGFAIVLAVPAGHELRLLGVDPAAWGRGVASALLDAVVGRAREAGVAVVELWVLVENRRAIDVYLRARWSRTGNLKSQRDTRRVEERLERVLEPLR